MLKLICIFAFNSLRRLKPTLQICAIAFNLIGCNNSSLPQDSTFIEIAGRGNGLSQRQPIYRIKAPRFWKYTHPPLSDLLLDTTLPLCEFHIEEGEQNIRITIHNFPSDKIEERVPPKAQIARWKQQFDELDPSSISIVPQAFSGFSGSFFEASGVNKSQDVTVLGWSMQIGVEHYRNLNLYPHPIHKQMRADATIKVVGPSDLILKHRHAIIAFARSFELINEIPTRS